MQVVYHGGRFDGVQQESVVVQLPGNVMKHLVVSGFLWGIAQGLAGGGGNHRHLSATCHATSATMEPKTKSAHL